MKHDPLSYRCDALVALVEGRKPRQHGIIVIGHGKKRGAAQGLSPFFKVGVLRNKPFTLYLNAVAESKCLLDVRRTRLNCHGSM